MTRIEYAKQFIAKAIQLQSERANETKMRDNFTSYLRNMFPDNPKWVNDHIEGAETHIHLVRGNRQITGFIDNYIDSIAIEYEKNLSIKSVYKEGYRQVKEYCAALVREGVPVEMILGILSDTVHWYVFEVEQNPNITIDQYNETNIELRRVDVFDASSDNPRVIDDFLRFLSTYLGRQGGREITAKRLASDFGLQSIYSTEYRTSIFEYVNAHIEANPSYYNMVETLWNKFVESHNSTPDNNESYKSEFYISIIAKLLCANLINKQALSSSVDQLCDIVNGRFFENRNIENFVDYDYFGWLNADIIQLAHVLSKIQDDLKVYDFSKAPEEDLFGELMVQLANRTQRIMLGQELTPRWLAKELVKKVIDSLPQGLYPQFVDMCCGSGSMIVETIRYTSKILPPDIERREQILKNCVSGFDIDPLAVILAKINWLISIYGLISHDEEIFIPIYHADSLFLDSPITNRKVSSIPNTIQLELYDRRIGMPQYAISSDYKNCFDQIVNKCYDCIHEDIAKKEYVELIERLICGNVEEERLHEMSEFAYNLYRALHELDLEGKNGIWAFVLKNTFRPNLISARFNGIVTNTPWLAMSKIGSNPYKESLKHIAQSIGIYPAGSSFPHLELATVFLLSSIHRYLQDDGVFGCILPDSIMTGTQHEKFRTGEFSKKKIKANFDEFWELPLETFKNRSVAILGRKRNYCKNDCYPGRKYDEKDVYENVVFNVSESTTKCVWSLSTMTDSAISTEKYSFKQGADIMPRCFFFFSLRDNGNTVQISTIQNNEEYSYFLKDMKVGKNLVYSCDGVPKKFLKEVVISNVLLPFNLCELPKAVLPIEKIGDEWHELEKTKMLSYQRSFNNLLTDIRKDYRNIKGYDDMYGHTLNMRAKLEQQTLQSGKYLVVYGAGGANICSAYIYIDNPERYVIDQTVYWTMVETKDEAIYLSSMLNCPALTEIISVFQPQGIFGKRHVHTLPLEYIPHYNPNNAFHTDLVRVGQYLKDELTDALPNELLNPNNGALSSRRKRITQILKQLPSYSIYTDSCKRILTEK